MQERQRSPYDVLTQTDRVVGLRARHRDYYLDLAETAAPELRGPDQVKWLDVLEAEHDNLRTALEWSLSTADGDASLRMATSLYRFWERHPREASRWLRRAAEANPTPSPLLARALVLASECEQSGTKDWAASRSFADRALEVARETGDDVEIARALIRVSYTQSFEQRHEEARSSAEEGLILARASGDAFLTALALRNLAFAVWGLEGSPANARPLVEESVAIARATGDKAVLVGSLYHLISWSESGPARRPLEDEAMQLCREFRNDVELSWTLDAIGWSTLFSDGIAPARAAWGEALQVVRAMAPPASLDYFLVAVGVVEWFAGDFASARALFEEARSLDGISRTWALSNLSQLALTEGDADRALALAEASLERGRVQWGGRLALGAALCARGDHDGARAAYESAIEDTDRALWIGQAARSLAAMAMRLGDLDLARRSFERAALGKGGVHAAATTRGLADLALLEGRVEQAGELHRQALTTCREAGSRSAIPWSFEGLASVAQAQDQPQETARLLGAAERFREDYGCVREAWWFRGDCDYLGRDDYQRAIEQLRATLGAQAFEAAWNAGRAMTEDEAVAYALRT